MFSGSVCEQKTSSLFEEGGREGGREGVFSLLLHGAAKSQLANY